MIFAQGPGAGDLIQRVGSDLMKVKIKKSGVFTIHRWHPKYEYWEEQTSILARPLPSVVLEREVKVKVVDDIKDFLTVDTLHFYLDHGIPYKRSFLFYGPPGGGKTSMIQALAGHFNRCVCYLQPAHPEMTDDGLKSAVMKAPDRAIIVLEDIDSLFTENRESANGRGGGNLTLSGLLNTLDGVGMPLGQIFVLTTNHRERLDKALIRPGRVATHVYFGHATPTMTKELFLAFYPESPALAEPFSSAARRIGGK